MTRRHAVNDGAGSQAGMSREEKWSGKAVKGSVE